MSTYPDDLKYASSHEWVKIDDDGIATVGISDHAQQALGDIVFIELPELNTVVAAGNDIAVVESVKAASDIYTPISGEVIDINEALVDAPEIVNSDPYEQGWLFKLKPSDEADLDELMDADTYKEMCDEE
ncbi:MAG: glycine cleavage system protein GcvH [Gammaproteobacteria bacterium]|nr:glycine cleavage system protein GcvH [Gammaproteobacteria bacterium]